jgi:hypothetical protein
MPSLMSLMPSTAPDSLLFYLPRNYFACGSHLFFRRCSVYTTEERCEMLARRVCVGGRGGEGAGRGGWKGTGRLGSVRATSHDGPCAYR